MTDTPETADRPVPRWVRGWAVLTAAVAFLTLFLLGALVTSFRAGMADPDWPTVPHYLAVNESAGRGFGFVIEHSHRAAGWVVGGLVSVLAVGAWRATPGRGLRWAGLGAVVGLLVLYGEFHRAMMDGVRAEERREAHGWPVPAGVATAVAAALTLAVAGYGMAAGRDYGRWARGLTLVALVMVMVQGLLGGFRVALHAWVGPQMAAVHGVFGQLTFCALVATAVLAAPRRTGDSLPDADRGRLLLPAVALVGLLVVQLVWGVWVRHLPTPLPARLHLLTAFAAAGVLVWMAVRVLTLPAGRRLHRGAAVHLLGLLALQLALGVEAWMGKFAADGPARVDLVRGRPPTDAQAYLRTAHVLVGLGLLASAVALAVRVGRRPLTHPAIDAEPEPAPAAAAPHPVAV